MIMGMRFPIWWLDRTELKSENSIKDNVLIFEMGIVLFFINEVYGVRYQGNTRSKNNYRELDVDFLFQK